MVVRIRDSSKGGFVPYVPPSKPSTPSSSSKSSGGGGGGSSSGSSSGSQGGTVYIYKGKEYYSEADVKNAIAQNILASEPVQTILKKQGGSSQEVYIYKGSTYTSPAEVQAQIQKETVSSVPVTTQVQTDTVSRAATPSGFAEKPSSVPGLVMFTGSPFSMSSRWLESDVAEEKPGLVSKGKSLVISYGKGALEAAELKRKTKQVFSIPNLISTVAKSKSKKEFVGSAVSQVGGLAGEYKKSKNVPTFLTGTGYAVGVFNPWIGGGLVAGGKSLKGFQETETEDLTGKEAGRIAGVGVAEGVLFAVGGKFLSGGAGWVSKKVAGVAAKESVPAVVKSGAGFVSKYSPAVGRYAKNLVDTYFIGMMGSESVKLGKESVSGFRTGEWSPAQRTGIGLGSSLLGYGVGSYALGKGFRRKPKLEEVREIREVRQPEGLTGVDLTKQGQPKVSFEGNIKEPKQPKVKQPEVISVRTVVERPIISFRKGAVSPFVSEIKARTPEGKVEDLFIKGVQVSRPIKDVSLVFGQGKKSVLEPLVPESKTGVFIKEQPSIMVTTPSFVKPLETGAVPDYMLSLLALRKGMIMRLFLLVRNQV